MLSENHVIPEMDQVTSCLEEISHGAEDRGNQIGDGILMSPVHFSHEVQESVTCGVKCTKS